MNLDAKIESLLFFKNEPISAKKISVLLGESEENVAQALVQLRERLQNGGIVLVEGVDEFTLGTHKDASEILEKIRKDEMGKELTKSALETLSIILYSRDRNGISGATRSEIDYIRGVNSTFILRNLLMRGLVRKEVDPNDSRRFLYRPTIETFEFMGITSPEELPEYQQTLNALQNKLEIKDTMTENE